jgi:hypothetical protein
MKFIYKLETQSLVFEVIKAEMLLDIRKELDGYEVHDMNTYIGNTRGLEIHFSEGLYAGRVLRIEASKPDKIKYLSKIRHYWFDRIGPSRAIKKLLDEVRRQPNGIKISLSKHDKKADVFIPKPMSLKAAALYCAIQRMPVTEDNKDRLAREAGHKSGAKLKQDVNEWISFPKRKQFIEGLQNKKACTTLSSQYDEILGLVDDRGQVEREVQLILDRRTDLDRDGF